MWNNFFRAILKMGGTFVPPPLPRLVNSETSCFRASRNKGFLRLIKRDRNAGFTWYLGTVLPDWWFLKVELIVAIWCWARFVYQCLYLSNTTRWEIIASWWQQIHSGVPILSNEVMQKMTLLLISLAFLLSLNSLTILIFNA